MKNRLEYMLSSPKSHKIPLYAADTLPVLSHYIPDIMPDPMDHVELPKLLADQATSYAASMALAEMQKPIRKYKPLATIQCNSFTHVSLGISKDATLYIRCKYRPYDRERYIDFQYSKNIADQYWYTSYDPNDAPIDDMDIVAGHVATIIDKWDYMWSVIGKLLTVQNQCKSAQKRQSWVHWLSIRMDQCVYAWETDKYATWGN